MGSPQPSIAYDLLDTRRTNIEALVKDPADLELDEKVFLLQNFFMANWDNMITCYPRYRDLLLKRGWFVSVPELQKVARRFSNQELLDLQVWYNLTWFGFIYKNEDEGNHHLLRAAHKLYFASCLCR